MSGRLVAVVQVVAILQVGDVDIAAVQVVAIIQVGDVDIAVVRLVPAPTSWLVPR